MRKSTMLAVAFAALLVCGSTIAGVRSAACAPPAQWSLARASFGLDAKAGVFGVEGQRSEAFLPGAYFSYSAASNLSLAATVERDFASHLTVAQGGVRVRVLDTDRGDIAGGVNLVSYSDEGAQGLAKPTSWNAGVSGAWDAVKGRDGRTAVWAIASAYWDSQNNIKTLRAGLRLQLLGGHPIYEAEATQ